MPIDAVTDIENYASPSGARRPTSPIPPDCSPQRFLDWRLRRAIHLAENADQLSIEH